MNNVTLSDEAQICPPVLEPASPAQRTQSPNARRAFIYALTDPRDGQIRYVGKTFNLESRFRGHLKEKIGSKKNNWIHGLKTAGLAPSIELLETVECKSDSDWAEVERFWISTLSFYGFRLLNLTSGGDSGFSMSPETRAKISRIASNRPLSWRINKSQQRKNLPQSVRDIISEKNKLRPPPSAETRLKMSQSQKGKKHKPETYLKMAESRRRFWSSLTPERRAEIVGKIHKKTQLLIYEITKTN